MIGKKNAQFPNQRKRLPGGTHISTSTKNTKALFVLISHQTYKLIGFKSILIDCSDL